MRRIAPTSSTTDCETRTCPPTVNDSMRLAMFTPLPTTVNELRFLRADVADDHLARVDADAHAELWTPVAQIGGVDLAHRVLHLDRTGDGGGSVLGHRGGCAEGHQQRVADDLVDGPAMAEADVDHHLEVGVEQRYDLLGRHTLCERREAAQVSHEDGDPTPLPSELETRRLREERLHDLRRHVATEHLLEERT